MEEKTKIKLQQPAHTRFFITIPMRFIKRLRWVKGEELNIEMKKDKIIIYR